MPLLRFGSLGNQPYLVFSTAYSAERETASSSVASQIANRSLLNHHRLSRTPDCQWVETLHLAYEVVVVSAGSLYSLRE